MHVTLEENELQAWRRLDIAAKAILVAQPAGMTAAAMELAEARREFESVMISAMTAWGKALSQPGTEQRSESRADCIEHPVEEGKLI